MAYKSYVKSMEESCRIAKTEGQEMGKIVGNEIAATKPLVLIAASYSEANDHLKRNTARPEIKMHVVTPAQGIERLRGWRSDRCDIEYVPGWDRTTGQGAAYREKVMDLREYLVNEGWMK